MDKENEETPQEPNFWQLLRYLETDVLQAASKLRDEHEGLFRYHVDILFDHAYQLKRAVDKM